MKPALHAADAFQREFGAAPSLFAWAPGRVNLIGEHVDYAGGSVLPAALKQGVTVAAAVGQQGRVRLHSDQYLEAGVAEFDPRTPPPQAYSAFVHALAVETQVAGADLAVVSDLPVERGWSSSAAFAAAVASALLALNSQRQALSALDLCRLCQRAEMRALGVACGLMDQFAAVFGRQGQGVLLDTRSLEQPALRYEYIPLNLGDARLLLIDSGQPRKLAGSGYNQRRSELSQALELLAARLAQPMHWRDIPRERLYELLEQLPELLMRRLRHVITEQERVERFAAKLKSGAVVELGGLLSATQASLSADYDVSTPELDVLCELLSNEAGVYGARLVGGGFGGGVLALADHGALPQHIDNALAAYQKRTGLQASWAEVQSGDGAMLQFEGGAPQRVAEWLI